MKLYNTLTHTKDEFIPHDPSCVTMYTCGPTVYHFAHIGNLRTYIMEDILEKTLRYVGYPVKRAMNITDVGHLTSDGDTGEDKMLKGARREKKTVMEIAQFYTDAFFADCDDLNIKRPDVIAPATDCIDEFIEMVSGLLDRGYAYISGGNVYFDTAKLDNYYVFGDMSADELEVGVREGVEEDGSKRNKTDFVLWFTKSKFEDQELKWDSPWGVGYPGWHIECSAIALKNLGEYLDLHCGGVDNAFPHHTNEIAQSEAYIGHPWCRHWFHVLHLNTAGGKMSKSKGEFLTVSLLKEKGCDPLAYRFFCLQSHYRRPLAFSWESLDNAAAAYTKLRERTSSLGTDGELSEEDAAAWKGRFADELANDLGSAMAITVLWDLLKSSLSDGAKRALVADFDTVLSLDLLEPVKKDAADSDLAAYAEEMIALRAEAKKAKNYAEADRIRAELLDRGIVLTDTRDGTTWALK